MQQYTLKRIGLFIPTLLLMTILVFVVMRIVPGDPAIALLEGDGGGSYSAQDLQNLREELGTDRNIAAQYMTWIGGIMHGDFGDSYWFKASVMTELGDRMPRTLELAVFAIVLSVVFSVPLGVISAIKPNSWLDFGARSFTIVGIAIPNFLMAILMIIFLLTVFNWLPPLGYVELWEDPIKNMQQMIFPAIALAIYDMAFIARVTRSAMMEVLREDYMRTARAKGLSERVVLVRHGLKNAFLPILTISGWQFARLFEGAVIIETIFLIPGVGRILIEAIFHRDFPMIQAVIVVIGTGVLLINLVVDLLYGWIDPRIRYN
jgi:peptide/nickel transport system permease protein|tara:strand:- start:567 stop:1523 length:957 start_codon:yes stop_codon:yes gene_type:complete